MKQFSYRQIRGDHTSFTNHSRNERTPDLLVYVDDIWKLEMMKKRRIETNRPRIWTNRARKTEVAYSNQGTFIYQQKYKTDLLAKAGKFGCRPVPTPNGS